MHAKTQFENQTLQREEAALDGSDKLLLHSEIEAIVDNCDLQDLMDSSGSCVYACDSNHEEEEAICFFTNRGYGNAIINFKVSHLDNQYKRSILYKGNSAINVNDVENAIVKRYQYLLKALWNRPGASGIGNKRDNTIPYPCIVESFTENR